MPRLLVVAALAAALLPVAAAAAEYALIWNGPVAGQEPADFVDGPARRGFRPDHEAALARPQHDGGPGRALWPG